MKSYVIGGLGMIGSALVDALKDVGHEVVVVDNGSQSALLPSQSRADKVWTWDARYLRQLGSEQHADYVFHCASPAGPARIQPGYALQQILELTQSGLEFAARVGARFVKFSTSEVYGRSDVPLTETVLPLVQPYDARTEYQLGYLASECLLTNHPYPPVQILRLFNVVGPKQSVESGCVIPRFCRQALKGEPLTIFGDGSQRRAFLAVEDLIRFVLLLMEKWPEKKQIWNVANPVNETSILHLATLISKATNPAAVNGPLIDWADGSLLTPHYRDGIEKHDISIEKARSLGWEPKVGIEEIVQKCLSAMQP